MVGGSGTPVAGFGIQQRRPVSCWTLASAVHVSLCFLGRVLRALVCLLQRTWGTFSSYFAIVDEQELISFPSGRKGFGGMQEVVKLGVPRTMQCCHHQTSHSCSFMVEFVCLSHL